MSFFTLTDTMDEWEHWVSPVHGENHDQIRFGFWFDTTTGLGSVANSLVW